MEKKQSLRIVMVPWLAHGHISPYFELAKRLSDHNFQIYLCSTPITLASITKKLNNGYSESIKLVEFQIPSQPNLPPHLHTTSRLPPHLHDTLNYAFAMAANPTFSDIIQDLKPDILIYDFNQDWVSAVAAALNLPAVQFIIGSSIMYTYVLHRMKKPNQDFPFPAMNHPAIYWNRKFQEMFKPQKAAAGSAQTSSMRRSSGVLLIKSSFEVERKYLDYGSELLGRKMVPTGPLIQDPEVDEDVDSEIMDWLNRKQRYSTVFVAFGSESFPSREEREEIAKGLELSMVNFIWVLRFPFGEKISIEEEGFLEKMNTDTERGLVLIDKWVPQSRILAHPSIGGFVSHCGWGSTTEAMAFGVPIVAMPMQLDQPFNARLVEEEIGVGLEVMRDENGRFSGEEIGRLIRDVVAGENGKKIRDKAAEMKERMKIEKDDAIDGVVEELYKLHNKMNTSS